MSRSRDLANLAGDATGLETLTVSDITDLTATATELNYVDGVSSALQTQIDAKQASSGTFNGTIGSSAVFPTGSILQVVNNSTTSDIALGTSYTSLISKEITGVLEPSKILVIGTGGGDGYNSGTKTINVKITRGTSSTDTTVRECDYYCHIEGSQWTPLVLSMSGLDTSPTTGSITYTIWAKKTGGTATFRSPEIVIFEIAG